MRRDSFRAIADPTRREILNMTAQRPMNVNTVSERFDVSRAAVYKHIKILTECGLLVIRQQGRERYCEAKLGRLGEVSDWISRYQEFWNTKLDALGLYLEDVQAKDPSTVLPASKRRSKTKSRPQKTKTKPAALRKNKNT